MTARAQLEPTGDDRVKTTDLVFETQLAARIELVRRLGVEPHADHIEAASPFVADGQWRRADAILACAPPGHYGFRCALRFDCPSCTTRAQQALAVSIFETATTYAKPVALLVTLPSRTLDDLGPTLDQLVTLSATLRRQTWFRRACVAGVGAIECPRTLGGHRWNVHLHAVVDLRLDADEVAAWQVRADHAWADLTGVAGARFSLEPLRDLRSFAIYASKLSDPPPSWAPRRGSLPRSLEERLRSALHRRRLLSRWGARPGATQT